MMKYRGNPVYTLCSLKKIRRDSPISGCQWGLVNARRYESRKYTGCTGSTISTIKKSTVQFFTSLYRFNSSKGYAFDGLLPLALSKLYKTVATPTKITMFNA